LVIVQLNQKIIELLAEHEEPLIVYQIRKRLGIDRKRNSTILYRVGKLEEAGILERTGAEHEGSKKRETSDRFQLSLVGLLEAARSLQGHAKKAAIERCKRKIVGPWKTFALLYELEEVQTDWPAYYFFTEWLESDDGILHFLDTFGIWPMAGEPAAIYTFRRMIDLALLRRRGAWLTALPAFGVEYVHGEWVDDKWLEGEWVRSSEYENPYMALAELAANHEKFQKLDLILREVDRPIEEYFDRTAYAEIVEKLKAPLGETVAKKLAATPFFKERNASSTGVSSEIRRSLSPDAFINFYSSITVKPDRVIIGTDDPDGINPEWKEHCYVDVYDPNGLVERIPPKRASE
jgi:DNA-binding Lrp family transcriptional regulator